jgi:hypothetical protein
MLRVGMLFGRSAALDSMVLAYPIENEEAAERQKKTFRTQSVGTRIRFEASERFQSPHPPVPLRGIRRPPPSGGRWGVVGA